MGGIAPPSGLWWGQVPHLAQWRHQGSTGSMIYPDPESRSGSTYPVPDPDPSWKNTLFIRKISENFLILLFRTTHCAILLSIFRKNNHTGEVWPTMLHKIDKVNKFDGTPLLLSWFSSYLAMILVINLDFSHFRKNVGSGSGSTKPGSRIRILRVDPWTACQGSTGSTILPGPGPGPKTRVRVRVQKNIRVRVRVRVQRKIAGVKILSNIFGKSTDTCKFLQTKFTTNTDTYRKVHQEQ